MLFFSGMRTREPAEKIVGARQHPPTNPQMVPHLEIKPKPHYYEVLTTVATHTLTDA